MKRVLVSVVCASLLILLYANCTGGFKAASGSLASALSSSTGSGSSGTGTSTTVTPGQNTMSVSIGCNYVNEPCVSVTICEPGTSTCQTIDNVLLDTGSYGLRLFSSVVNLSLASVNDASGRSLTECMSYAGGNNQWGPVKKADVVMGGETASNVSIQMIDSTFATVPSSCADDQDTSPSEAGYNGILGVGLFTQDCGSECVSSANVGLYYGCSGSTCTGTTVALASQVSNPVSFLPASNNGVILTLPAISAGGADNVTGTLTLGIGTQADNTPSAVTTFGADVDGNFKTTYNGVSYDAFIDSGSNGLYFPSSITQCTGTNADFYCPTSTVIGSGTQTGASGSPSEAIAFSIANTNTLIAGNHDSLNDLGGTASGYFDWGLPFFFGRTIYVGIEGKSSNVGTGPYWSY